MPLDNLWGAQFFTGYPLVTVIFVVIAVVTAIQFRLLRERT